MEFEGVSFRWLGHDGFRLEAKGLVIYLDPFQLQDADEADLVLITHEHFDHCSVEDLKRVVGRKTRVVCARECLSAVARLDPAEVIPMSPGESKTVAGVAVAAVPAYNLDKFRAPGQPFHPKVDEKLGFVLDLGVKVYHAGDTDNIPEMKGVACDVALLPVSGTYVMTAEEAAEAVKVLDPKLAIPMHYGSIVGSESDAERFKRLASNVRVEVLDRRS